MAFSCGPLKEVILRPSIRLFSSNTKPEETAEKDGSSFTADSGTIWFGNGSSADASYTGLRFSNLQVPAGAQIVSARLRVYSVQNSWINLNMLMAAEAVGDSSTFSASNLPSTRLLTGTKVTHSSSTQWLANTWYDLDEMAPVVQEIVNRSDWQSGQSLSIILKGNGSTWGRKFVQSSEGSGGTAVQLVVTYN